MQKLLAVLILYQSNMKNLHWKMTSTDFGPNHELMDEYSDKLLELIDDIAEISMQLGINPLNVVEAISLLQNDSGNVIAVSGNDDITPLSGFEKINQMFEHLLTMYEDVYGKNYPADVINQLQEHAYWIRKELRYKNRRRLMGN